MSLFKKLKERIIPTTTVENAVPLFSEEEQIKHEFVNFPMSYRIGILCYFTTIEDQEEISNYKKKLEQLGYECDLIMFIDKKERENAVFLQSFDHNDLDKKTNMPHSPRTDRYIVKRYDLLINLYVQNCPQLLHISKLSQARCRVAPFMEHFKKHSDLMILCENDFSIKTIINNINKSLNLKPYERKQI